MEGTREDLRGPEERLRAQAFLRGDREIVQEVRVVILSVLRARGYGIPPEDRQELIQDTLLALIAILRRDAELEFSSGFHALTRTIAHRRCIDYRRARREHVEFEDTEHPGAANQESLAADEERRRHYRRVLARISKSCRELFELREKELSYETIAQYLGRSVGALRVQSHQCLKQARVIARELEQSRGPRSVESGQVP